MVAQEQLAITENKEVTTSEVKIDSSTDTSNGVSIYVKLTIKNNAYEGLSDDNIVLKVSGTTNNSSSAASKDQLADGGDGGFNDSRTLQPKPCLNAQQFQQLVEALQLQIQNKNVNFHNQGTLMPAFVVGVRQPKMK